MGISELFEGEDSARPQAESGRSWDERKMYQNKCLSNGTQPFVRLTNLTNLGPRDKVEKVCVPVSGIVI